MRWLTTLGGDARTGCGANAYDTAIMMADSFGDGASTGLPGQAIVEFGFAETPDGGKHFDFPLSARIVRNGRIERTD